MAKTSVPALTETNLTAMGKKWQRRLRLDHWDVSFGIARLHEFQSADGACAQTQIDDPWTHAGILMLHPSDLETRAAIRSHPHVFLDWEVSLVHELLHLHLWGVHAEKDRPNGDSAEYVAMERAIDAIARALVEASRGTSR